MIAVRRCCCWSTAGACVDRCATHGRRSQRAARALRARPARGVGRHAAVLAGLGVGRRRRDAVLRPVLVSRAARVHHAAAHAAQRPPQPDPGLLHRAAAAVRDRRARAASTCSPCSSRSTCSSPSRWSARWPATRSAFSSATPRSSGASWSASTACPTRRRCCCSTLPSYEGRGAFLLFFLVVVVAVRRWCRSWPAAGCGGARWRARSAAASRCAPGSRRAWRPAGRRCAVLDHAVQAAPGAGDGLRRRRRRHARRIRDEGAEARRRRAPWGKRSRVTGAVGLLDRVAPLCFAAPVFFHSVRWYFGV